MRSKHLALALLAAAQFLVVLDPSTVSVGLGVLSLVLLVSFVVIELNRRYPLIPFSIFKLRTLSGANVIGTADSRRMSEEARTGASQAVPA